MTEQEIDGPIDCGVTRILSDSYVYEFPEHIFSIPV